jgi:hypothetical protein
MPFVFLWQILRVKRETLVAVKGHRIVASVYHRLCKIDQQYLFALHDEMMQLKRHILRDAERVNPAHAEHRAATGNNRTTVNLQENRQWKGKRPQENAHEQLRIAQRSIWA